MAQALVVKSYNFFNLYVNVQLVKCDIVTAVIYYYTTTKFHYTKRDSRLSAPIWRCALSSVFFNFKHVKISAIMPIYKRFPPYITPPYSESRFV